jgi:hypothetical protein
MGTKAMTRLRHRSRVRLFKSRFPRVRLRRRLQNTAIRMGTKAMTRLRQHL